MANYGKTETELLVEETLQCRQIIKEITKFGVSQKQILKIIELLSLELENIEHTREICGLIKELNNLSVIDDETTQEGLKLV
jgi:hypothetical protein